MDPMRYLGVFLAACLSCTLSGCVAATPDDAEDKVAAGDESAAEDENSGALEEGEEAMTEDATGEVSSEIQSGPANAMGCHPDGGYCLARCSRSGNALLVVGHWNDINNCLARSEQYCNTTRLGYRTQFCWGYVNDL